MEDTILREHKASKRETACDAAPHANDVEQAAFVRGDRANFQRWLHPGRAAHNGGQGMGPGRVLLEFELHHQARPRVGVRHGG